MSIKYTPEDNDRIRRIVNTYNAKVRSAHSKDKIPKKRLPELASIATIKKSYNKRADLNRELKNLQLFSKTLTEVVDENEMNGPVTKYDIELIKANRKAASNYFKKQIELIKSTMKGYSPIQQQRIDLIQEHVDLLDDMDLGKATLSELKSMERYVDKYRRNFERQASGYRGFLSEVEVIMDRVGVSEAKKEEFFNKLSKLNSEEFYQLYEKYDIIDAIYRLADSPKYTGGEWIIYDDGERAGQLVDELLEDIDVMIESVKAK